MHKLIMPAILAGLVLAGLVPAGAARAEDTGTPLDCGDMPMHFTGQGFQVTCKDYSDSTVLDGGTKVQFLSALAEDKVVVINAADVRALGSIYIKRRGLLEDMKTYYDQETYDDWQDGGETAGFETAEYTGKDDQGAGAPCLAFRRYVMRRDAGFGRMVIGFGCSVAGRKRLIDALKQLDAPGG